MAVALAGFHRLGELLPKKDTSRRLFISHLRVVAKDHVELTIPASKTDPNRKSVRVQLFGVGGAMCPVAAITDLHAKAPLLAKASKLLFPTADGRQANRDSWFVPLMRRLLGQLEQRWHIGIDPAAFTGHSFREGAALTAALHQIPEQTIMTLGRWTSDAFRRYLKLPPIALKQHAIRFMQVSVQGAKAVAAKLLKMQLPAALRT